MWTKYILLAFIGICGGSLIATGYFALITALGILTTFSQRTHTSKHIVRYEDAIILGGILGNIIWVFQLNLNSGYTWLNYIQLAVYGLFYGIFIGSLILALAENLKVLPIFFRRAMITKGLAVLILAYAVGKGIGNMIYSLFSLGSGG